MIGIGAGALLFAVAFPWLEGFYKVTNMGTVTLPELTGINHWVLVAILYVLAGSMFYAMERYERSGFPSSSEEPGTVPLDPEILSTQ